MAKTPRQKRELPSPVLLAGRYLPRARLRWSQNRSRSRSPIVHRPRRPGLDSTAIGRSAQGLNVAARREGTLLRLQIEEWRAIQAVEPADVEGRPVPCQEPDKGYAD